MIFINRDTNEEFGTAKITGLKIKTLGTVTDEDYFGQEKYSSDEEMYNAVKKVLLEGIYFHGVNKPGQVADPLVNGALSLAALSTTNPIPDVELGAHIRGVWAGLNALENAYKKLKNITSKVAEVESPYNEAI